MYFFTGNIRSAANVFQRSKPLGEGSENASGAIGEKPDLVVK